MNNRRTKELPKIIFFQLSVVILTLGLGLSILFYAQGFRFNAKNFKVIKTGVLFLSTLPKGAEVTINDEPKEMLTPYAANFKPDYYSVKVFLDGYHDWTEGVRIDPELVSSYKNIILFKTNPSIDVLTDPKKIALLNAPSDLLAVSGNLKYTEYEIWADNRIVTRFSEPIQKAIWYSDNEHIIFQQGDEIRSIEVGGGNDTLLVKLTGDKLTNFAFNNRGDELYFIDDSQYKIAKVR